MHYRAEITARNEEGVLERILRVCRHRGFWINRMSAELNFSKDSICIDIEGESERLPFYLMRQIEKLDECRMVSVNKSSLENTATKSAAEIYVCPSNTERNVYASPSRA